MDAPDLRVGAKVTDRRVGGHVVVRRGPGTAGIDGAR